MSMKYTRVGKTGLEVSRLCLGGNSWGAAGRRSWAGFGPEESRPFFKRALDLGINFFDTAPAYNDGASEDVLGSELVSQVDRQDLVLMTKVGYPRPGANRSGMGRKNVIASVEASLKRLRTDYLDLLVIHRYDTETPLEETIEALAELVRSGKVRYIGASAMPVRHFIRLHLSAKQTPAHGLAMMQNLYNLLYREDEPELIPFCEEERIGLTPYSPLARGLLAGSREADGSGTTERAQADAKNVTRYVQSHTAAILDAVKTIAAARSVKPAQIPLAWLLSRDAVTAPVIGATKVSHLDDAVEALTITLSDAEIDLLERPYRSIGFQGRPS